MANEVLHSGLGDLSLSEVASQTYLLLTADRSTLGNHPALVYGGDLAGSRSSVMQLSQLGWEGYDVLASASTENETTVNTAFTDSSTTLTIALQKSMYSVSELAQVVGSDLGIFTKGTELGREAAIRREIKLRDMICNVTDNFTQTAGQSGVDLSIDDINQAKRLLQAQGVEGPYIGILHPVQWEDLVNAIRDELTLSQTSEMLQALAVGSGWQGRALGIDWYVSTSVPTANAGADRAGAIFGKGAVAWADATLPEKLLGSPDRINLGKAQVKFEEDASVAMTEVHFSCYLAVSKGVDLAGVSVITKA